MGLQSNGLSLEVVGREISGRPVPGKPRRPAGPYLLGLPALLLSCLLLVPIGVTVVAAFRTADGSFGFGNFAVMGDPAALHAVGNSLAWIAVALALVVLGFLLALLSYRLPGLSSFLQPALVIPFAVSVLVSGATFRLIFDPAPERGSVTAVWTRLFGTSPVWLGPGLFWLVLVSAFGWTWLGYVVSLFRAGLDAIPADVSRTIAAEGVTGWRRVLALELPLLRPITGVVTLTLVIAAVRVFDLVLIVVPGPMQRAADVLGLNWWRATSAGDDAGRTAALGVVLFAIVAAVAVIGVRGLRRRRWAVPVPVVPPDPTLRRPKPSRRVRRTGWSVGFAVSLFWILPALVLVATALHSPREAGLRGWWSLSGVGLSSFDAAASADLVHRDDRAAGHCRADCLPRGLGWTTSAAGSSGHLCLRGACRHACADVRRATERRDRYGGPGRFTGDAGLGTRGCRSAVRRVAAALGLCVGTTCPGCRGIAGAGTTERSTGYRAADVSARPGGCGSARVRAGVERLHRGLLDQWTRYYAAVAGAVG
jgi:alpha-glucoside transport system permease protein